MINTIRTSPPSAQRGVSTLLVAMIFLAILTIVALFGAKVGLSEQRTSGNEYRYKMAFQVAEAGLGQSIEYIKGNTKNLVSKTDTGWLFDGDPHWEPCTVAFSGALDPCKQLPAYVAAGSYRYVGPAAGDHSGKLPLKAIAGTTDSVGDFKSSFESYATLCLLDVTTAAPTCSLSPSKEGTYYVTIVSAGHLDNESANATVKQSFGTFRLFGRAPDAPLIAAGTVTALGNSQIIPNPNAAGFGIPVSVWTPKPATIDQASFATCHLSSWLANYGTPAPSGTDIVNGVCASCTCNDLCPETGGLISGNAKSCSVAKDKLEGEDILDVDSNVSDASPKLRDSKYFPSDLFAYVFGRPTSEAVTYLTDNAKPLADCSALNAGSSGLYWFRGASCDLGGNIVGTLQDPVVLVSDAPVQTNAGGQFFGIVFIRSVAGTGQLLKAVGGAQFYGSVILEGEGALGGNPTIVYNKAVLQNVLNSPSFVRYAAIPGSWSDTVE